ncbi:hypothetical protein Cgig2_017010 [Carnegiea gigantea]|uniref:Rapid alkalinization factor-like n=1 Tax=Carnegiea gigantea TaxID=171969 RepID=A0A9Q1KHW8_9CARY|nr:hypothetical protein Cgig2_017010 [Carnegiea gigantea]
MLAVGVAYIDRNPGRRCRQGSVRSDGLSRVGARLGRHYAWVVCLGLGDDFEFLTIIPIDVAFVRPERESETKLERETTTIMADGRNLLSILTVGLLISSASILAVDAGVDFEAAAGQMGWIGSGSGSGCRGTVGECMGLEEEFEMDSDIHRRILATTSYISYGALNKNRVPCSRRGASYYNCRPGAQANPYTRGCSAITRCKR